MVERTCVVCGSAFEVPYPSAKRKTCSYDCRWQSMRTAPRAPRADTGTRKTKWVQGQCAFCGKTFEAPPARFRNARKRGWKVFCSVACKESVPQPGRPPDPTKSRRINHDGYVTIYVPHAERPPGWKKGAHLLEHRVVLGRVLGRHLEPHETVHHINGDKTDNRPENLQLRSGRHGKGGVLRCRACGSSDIEHLDL